VGIKKLLSQLKAQVHRLHEQHWEILRKVAPKTKGRMKSHWPLLTDEEVPSFSLISWGNTNSERFGNIPLRVEKELMTF
jgi:hypothetical protein